MVIAATVIGLAETVTLVAAAGPAFTAFANGPLQKVVHKHTLSYSEVLEEVRTGIVRSARNQPGTVEYSNTHPGWEQRAGLVSKNGN